MNDIPASEAAARIVATLRDRDGVGTEVRTVAGKTYLVFNIAWGQDLGDPEFHVTTNISPTPPANPPIDFFSTKEVVAIVAPETGETLFVRPAT